MRDLVTAIGVVSYFFGSGFILIGSFYFGAISETKLTNNELDIEIHSI